MDSKPVKCQSSLSSSRAETYLLKDSRSIKLFHLDSRTSAESESVGSRAADSAARTVFPDRRSIYGNCETTGKKKHLRISYRDHWLQEGLADFHLPVEPAPLSNFQVEHVSLK